MRSKILLKLIFASCVYYSDRGYICWHAAKQRWNAFQALRTAYRSRLYPCCTAALLHWHGCQTLLFVFCDTSWDMPWNVMGTNDMPWHVLREAAACRDIPRYTVTCRDGSSSAATCRGISYIETSSAARHNISWQIVTRCGIIEGKSMILSIWCRTERSVVHQ